ncbi:MAG: energy-coupling factor transporter transmembrane component T [Clostridiaceae bacterium]
MLKDITIGQYVPGDSFIHKLDPRTKIIISMLFVAALFIINKFVGYIFVIAFLSAAIINSRIAPGFFFKGLKPIVALIVITAVLNAFMIKGSPENLIWGWKFIFVYKEGLQTAAFMALRLVFLIIGTSILTLTTSPIELTDALEILLKPLKVIGVSSHEIAMMMTIALRFIPTLVDETDKIMKAQKARGADFEGGSVLQKANNLIPLLVPLFISSFRRADELAMAMEARCYRGGTGRTRMKQLKYEIRDAGAYLIIGALIVISFYIRFKL